MLQTESTTMVLPTFCTSCFEHLSPRMPPPMEFIALSVSASMQCCMVCAGRLRLSNVIVISHRPALRAGMSDRGDRRGKDAKRGEGEGRAHAILLSRCLIGATRLTSAGGTWQRPPVAAAHPECSMKLLTVHHATTYRYSAPVTFGQHRLMLRPRDSHDLRLVDAELALSPPGTLRWMHDVFGNSVALVDFEAAGRGAFHRATLRIERYALARPDFPYRSRRRELSVHPFGRRSLRSRPAAGAALSRPANVVDEWARQFTPFRAVGTLNLLVQHEQGDP